MSYSFILKGLLTDDCYKVLATINSHCSCVALGLGVLGTFPLLITGQRSLEVILILTLLLCTTSQ